MAITYTDNEIAMLIQERKPLPAKWRMRTKLLSKRGHDERDLDITGVSGNKFRLILRRNKINRLDFSVILAVLVPQSGQVFRLLRYNGKSHEHKNAIEGDAFYDYHIHMATERYQTTGAREDSYAVMTDRYKDYMEALHCMLKDGNFDVPPNNQLNLL